MKYLALITLFTVTAAQAQLISQNALEESFRISSTNSGALQLNAPDRTYVELNADDKKAFVKNEGDDKMKISASKDGEGKLDVYQLKLEKFGDEVKKIEKIVEYDKEAVGTKKIKKVVKCEEGSCQAYKKPFCDALLGRQGSINSQDLQQIKDQIYKANDCEGASPAEVAKIGNMSSETRNEFRISVPNSLESAVRSNYTPATSSSNFTVAKVQRDLEECDKIKDEFIENERGLNHRHGTNGVRVSSVRH